MSMIERVVRRAREKPAELTVNDADVGSLVDEILASTRHPDSPSHMHLEQQIRAGEMKFMGLPLRVLIPASHTANT